MRGGGGGGGDTATEEGGGEEKEDYGSVTMSSVCVRLCLFTCLCREAR